MIHQNMMRPTPGGGGVNSNTLECRDAQVENHWSKATADNLEGAPFWEISDFQGEGPVQGKM